MFIKITKIKNPLPLYWTGTTASVHICFVLPFLHVLYILWIAQNFVIVIWISSEMMIYDLFPFPGVRINIGQQCATSPLGSVCAVVGV